jgi:hypothetical protein
MEVKAAAVMGVGDYGYLLVGLVVLENDASNFSIGLV